MSTAHLSSFLQSSLTGTTVSQYREDNELIEILLRGTRQERSELSNLGSLALPTDNGQSVALSQVATPSMASRKVLSGIATACRR